MRLVALTEKQKRFCDEYLIDLNATQAAIRAGYSEKTARQTATENLSKPYIREYIDKRLAEKDAELIADQDEVLKYLTSVMRREKNEHIVVTTSDQSHKRYIVMKGSAGSGKSVDTAQNYILRLMKDKGRNLVCIRKSDITNRDSTFAELTGSLQSWWTKQCSIFFLVLMDL